MDTAKQAQLHSHHYEILGRENCIDVACSAMHQKEKMRRPSKVVHDTHDQSQAGQDNFIETAACLLIMTMRFPALSPPPVT